jgi:hypothetical protein
MAARQGCEREAVVVAQRSTVRVETPRAIAMGVRPIRKPLEVGAKRRLGMVWVTELVDAVVSQRAVDCAGV